MQYKCNNSLSKVKKNIIGTCLILCIICKKNFCKKYVKKNFVPA